MGAAKKAFKRAIEISVPDKLLGKNFARKAVGGFGIADFLQGPDIKMPEAPPPPPSIDDASEAQRRGDEARKRRGMAATILTSPQGLSGGAGKSTLLGR